MRYSLAKMSHEHYLQALAWTGLLAVLVLAAYMRFTAVNDSIVLHPYRGDAAVYYTTAYNLHKYGVYSRNRNTIIRQQDSPAPTPDAFATPGYPLFLEPFVSTPPDSQTFRSVALWQAAIGTITVLLTFMFFRRISKLWVALLAAALVAISPHLVNTTIYLLSETVFAFWLMLAALVFALHQRGDRWYYPSLVLAGVLFGIAALTRPVVEFFPVALVFLLFTSQPRPQAARGAAILVFGFMLTWAPWLVRNHISVGHSGDPTVLISSLHQGMYPGMMYHDDPASQGYAYYADPSYAAENRSLGTATQAILGQFARHPAKELYWYLAGKPLLLWSWTLVAGSGDIFIYPTFLSPYSTGAPLFLFTHALMYGLHWMLVILALIASLAVWTRYARRYLNGPQIVAARMVSLLLFYNTAVLMVLSPYVRYSIPFLPFEFGMAALAAYMLGNDAKTLRARSRNDAIRKKQNQ
ncbi:MAG TPA: phospholipid carrier-dependent glycosyltransferase [Gammaproteobacteria bacterium]|nr:phospholipid carrier-dependent glycosyltransferase [Gammaproteobacteria bacterium]